MILQYHHEHNTVRLFTQHDHGLLSGELAHVWEPRQSMALVMAIAAHDMAWHEVDALETLSPHEITFDTERGMLHDFLTLPYERKVPLYRQGIEQAQALHPYAGLLLSLHYAAFLDPLRFGDFMSEEEERRERLAAQLGYESWRDAKILRDYEALKFFDLISLFVCLRHPLARQVDAPRWITSTVRLDGVAHELNWRDEHTLTITGWPSPDPLDVVLPCRTLSSQRHASSAHLQSAYLAAPIEALHIRIEGA